MEKRREDMVGIYLHKSAGFIAEVTAVKTEQQALSYRFLVNRNYGLDVVHSRIWTEHCLRAQIGSVK